jgi:endo-beta-N-acetylglucosaminidase D
MNTNKIAHAEYLTKAANRAALEWADNAISTAERQVQEMKRNRERLVEAIEAHEPNQRSCFVSPQDVVSWMVNTAVGSYLNNMRIDLAPRVCADLVAAQIYTEQAVGEVAK